MIRHLTLCVFCCLCLGCVEKEEFTQAVPDNDFIEGTFAGRDFHLVQGSYLAGLETHFIAEQAVDGDAAAPQRRLLVRRTDEQSSYLLQFDLPLEAVQRGKQLPARVAGTLTWMDLYSDSYPGCPHIDTSSTELLPVSLQLEGWNEDALIGSYQSVDATRTGAGRFSLVIAQP